MRKTKLLLVALLAMMGLSVNAQSWTVPTITGEDPVDGTTYKLYNVGAAKFLTEGQAWFNWSTTAILADNGSDFTFTGDASSFTLTTHRSGNAKVFTSGNEIPGDAMHLDGGSATNYAYELLPSGNYQIHDAGVTEITTCWGYEFIAKTGSQAQRDSWGVVAHSDASSIGKNGEWLFVGDASFKLYDAQLQLYNLLNQAQSEGVNVSTAVGVYSNSSSTIEELNAASEALEQDIFDNRIKNASEESPADITEFRIDNPSFEKGLSGWTNSGMQTQGNKAFGKTVGAIYCEAWQPNGTKSVSQALTNLPQGLYKLTANALARGVTSAKLYAGKDETTIEIKDEAATYTVEFACKDGITIGFEGVGTGAGNSWLCVDNFKLSFVKSLTDQELADYELAAVKEIYEAALAAAKAFNQNTIPAAAYTGLQAAITKNNKTWSTASEYEAAIKELNDFTEGANTLAKAYAAAKGIKSLPTGYTALATAIDNAEKADYSNVAQFSTQATALNDAVEAATPVQDSYLAYLETAEAVKAMKDADTYTGAEAKSTLEGVLSSSSTDVEAATTADAIEEETAKLISAANTFVKNVKVKADASLDITCLIKNPHFHFGTTASPTGWTIESGKVTELRTLSHNFEAYHTQFNLSQTIKSLPKGTYEVTLQGFARHDNGGATDKTNLYCGIANQAIKSIKDEYSKKSICSGKPALGDNNGEVSYKIGEETVYQPNGMSGSCYFFQEINPMTEKPFYTNEVKTLITEAGDLKIGFKCETSNDWVIWDNFHLYYYGSAITVTLNEAEGAAFSQDIEDANVTLKKTIAKGWNTVILPISATKAEIGASELYTYNGDDAEGVLQFTSASSIEPNVPYLMKAATESNADIKFNGVTVKAAAESLAATGDAFDFVGTYTGTTASANDYVLTTNAFTKAKGGNTIKAYRAFIQKKAETGGKEARELKFEIDGVVTAIDAIDGKAVNNNTTIYNLAGQQVKNAKKGLYIQNGKKFVVK